MSRLDELIAQKIFLVDSLETGTLLSRSSRADLFPDGSESALEELLLSDFFEKYGTPVLIDMQKAVSLYLSSTEPDTGERQKTALMMGRVNFMGTDGIRGKVVLNPHKDFIAALLSDNAFTPDLVRITSFAFAEILKRNEIARPGDTFVVGNDGRDKAYEWKLITAVRDGFLRAGINVLDIGVVPTAIIPLKMLQNSFRGGACLTASHNPSNQNGIKFFIDGAKLLPEGDLGDYTLSAYMFNYCRLEELPDPCASVEEQNVEDEARNFMKQVLPDSMESILQECTLVFDSANGATHTIGTALLKELKVNFACTNETPRGDNINRECGVAEIEGTELFTAQEYDAHIPFVQELFDRGRAEGSGKVWGVPLDGDGDRGFLLYYDKDSDAVHVLDGDKCGYILARYLIEKKGADPKNTWFISTIESDIMTANAAEKNLGLNKKVVAVGDKWIGNFSEGQLLVGLEISGHLIFPIEVENNAGESQELLSGVGLLTGLITLAAVKELNLYREEILTPFEPGFSETLYTYFVDKSLFYRGSDIWKQDVDLIEEEVAAAKKEGHLPGDVQVSYEEKEDINVLYANIMSGDALLGVLFARNSGTEDKNAVYVKGQQEYKGVLSKIGTRVQGFHIAVMKNTSSVEYFCEKTVKDAVASGSTSVDDVLSLLENAGKEVSETDLFAVLHGMKKEGVVHVEGRTVSSK
ncbi:N-acetylglucosamine-1-P-mutase [Chitinivibrio alkaliphilus]|uniref:N-acetylglucosamine-1-P-mutase n=1 Tax=Chitinivibrio alkaliphilus ACht1 TaxID=1313304 RepID=U7DAN4_9BACT|nr:N-acetylglucosamine-1-P-mutase [Chitinivibrio alkaliphilus]ERP39092.1 N-acetylglucosamine-1-P-mutase [Chitinivibrio alkaliphilus ACht1]